MAYTQANSDSSEAQPPRSTETIYEVGYHLMANIPEAEVGGTADTIRQLIISRKGTILSEGLPQRMTLTYPIIRSVSGKRETFVDSYFGWVKFSAEAEDVEALNDPLRGMREVIRYIVIKTLRDDAPTTKHRAIFVSDRLEGETIQKPSVAPEKSEVVSEEELDKSLEAIVS